MDDGNRTGLEIAVIGMAGRFPGANNLDRFWENLKKGMESISFFTDDELEEGGISPKILKNPNYVKGRGIIEGSEYFDASFFGYTPAEAVIMDPQLRVALECSWHALEDAGYYPEDYDGPIGFYAGASANLLWEIQPFLSKKTTISGQFSKTHLIDKDFLSMRAAYALNLKGPAIAMFTTCSTSLVAVDMACRALLTGQCDMALAGGVSITLPLKRGYLYEEGMVMSSDGHVRAFDASASGTNGGDGVGFVVLKPLEDALADRDYIHALIKGSEVNNDGKRRVGFQAPSVEGQADVIRTALHIAEVEPESIGYIETHGTGTPLGDPIEIEALIRAFDTDKKQFCKIGSVKTNVGHLDSAAGIVSFIKTVLALKHKQIPPSLHFETPNPKIDFKNSPFYVNTELKEWRNDEYPLRAGVSSFGIGGTNAHVVLEEWLKFGGSGGACPPVDSELAKRQHQLIVLSAKTPSALEKMTENLANYLKENPVNPIQTLADAAYTLQVGRKTLEHRRMVVAATIEEAVERLASPDSGKVHTFVCKETRRPVIFMFAGQGSQYPNIGRDLYRDEPVFRREMDQCFDILTPLLGFSIKDILYPTESGDRPLEASDEHMLRQDIIQPLVFTFEYALAQLLMAWGIQPYAMIGYSLGEYVPACLAGVFNLKDALSLLVYRGKLMQEAAGGTMLSVPLNEEELKPLLGEDLCLAIVNGPSCVVSGAEDAITRFEKQLKGKKMMAMHLTMPHAMHSKMMDPLLQKFETKLRQIQLNPPQLPFISNVSGDWISREEAVNPLYWVNQFRQTVRFSDGLKELLKTKEAIFLEVGPGSDLGTILRQNVDNKTDQPLVLNTIRHPQQEISDVYYLLNRIGRLWLYGASIDWNAFYTGERRNRIPLPTYPFEQVLYPAQVSLSQDSFQKEGADRANISDWFYIPGWKVSMLPIEPPKELAESLNWLILGDDNHLTSRFAQKLQQQGQSVIRVNHYHTLTETLASLDRVPDRIVHLWGLTEPPERERVFDSLFYLARAVGTQALDKKMQLTVVSSNMQGVYGSDLLYPEKALLLGPVRVIPREYPNITCRSIDFDLNGQDGKKAQEEQLVHRLYREVMAQSSDPIIAYRGIYRLIQTFDPLPMEEPLPSAPIPRLRQKGVYMVVGGLGGIGLTLAEYLARTVQARLVLTGRSPLPQQNQWETWLEKHKDDADETTASKIKKLMELEKLGAEIAVFSADVSNDEQMKKVISAAEKRFGRINGIVHAAGIVLGGLIQQITPQQVDEGFKSKVNGTLVLDELSRDMNLDFFILCSSLNALVGALGEVTYCAANAFQDAFALYKASHDTNKVFTAAVNWDAWQGVGFAVEVEKRLGAAFKDFPGAAEGLFKHGMLPAEGVEVFKRVLTADTPRLVVSTVDLNDKFEEAEALKTPPTAETLRQMKDGKPRYPRPELSIPYSPPANKMERMLCETWEHFLGIEQVGIHDNFFELGASSLGIVQVNSILKETLKQDIPLPTMYAFPTVAELGRYLRHLNEDKAEGMPIPEETAQLEARTMGKQRLKRRKQKMNQDEMKADNKG